jgi:hypothetical protein
MILCPCSRHNEGEDEGGVGKDLCMLVGSREGVK